MSDSAALDWRRPPVRPALSGRDGRLRPVAFMHRRLEWVHYAGRARRRKTAPARTLRGWRRAVVAASVVAIAVGAAAAAFEIPASHGTGGSRGPVTEAAGIAGGALDGFAPKPNVSRLAPRQSSRRSDLHKRQRLVPPDTARRRHVEKIVRRTVTAQTVTTSTPTVAPVSSSPPTVATTAPSSPPVATPSPGSSSGASSKQPVYGPNGILGPGHGVGTG
jgi:hypothetical protein